MSTRWYMVCLDHTPTIRSEEAFTSHTNDYYYDMGLAFIKNRPLVDQNSRDFYRYDYLAHYPNHYLHQAVSFCLDHPDCNIGVKNEYSEEIVPIEVSHRKHKLKIIKTKRGRKTIKMFCEGCGTYFYYRKVSVHRILSGKTRFWNPRHLVQTYTPEKKDS